jgi:hypothetical protein
MQKEKETPEVELVIDDNQLLNNLRRIRIANIWTVRLFFAVLFADSSLIASECFATISASASSLLQSTTDMVAERMTDEL